MTLIASVNFRRERSTQVRAWNAARWAPPRGMKTGRRHEKQREAATPVPIVHDLSRASNPENRELETVQREPTD